MSQMWALWKSDVVAKAVAKAGGAKSAGESESAALTPQARALVSITITPDGASIASGGYQRFSAEGKFSDNSTDNVTTKVVWSSSKPEVASFDEGPLDTGVAMGRGVGSAQIKATDPKGSATGTTTLTVKAAPVVLKTITISPANLAMGAYTEKKLSAKGVFSDGSTKPLSSEIVWSSSKPAVVSIDATGLAYMASVGSAAITAQATTSPVKGTAKVTVKPPALTIAPRVDKFMVGSQFRFMVIPSDPQAETYGGMFVLRKAPVVWSSSAPKIVSIDDDGLATMKSVGAATVTAKAGGVAVSTKMTVLAPGPGARKVAVQVLMNDFRDLRMDDGKMVRMKFSSPLADNDVVIEGETKDGAFEWRDLSLMPQGSVFLEGIDPTMHTGNPSKVVPYTLPEAGILSFAAKQKDIKGRKAARNATEAAKKFGVTGRLGVDFKVFQGGVEVTEENEHRETKEESIEWEITAGTVGFELAQS